MTFEGSSAITDEDMFICFKEIRKQGWPIDNLWCSYYLLPDGSASEEEAVLKISIEDSIQGRSQEITMGRVVPFFYQSNTEKRALIIREVDAMLTAYYEEIEGSVVKKLEGGCCASHPQMISEEESSDDIEIVYVEDNVWQEILQGFDEEDLQDLTDEEILQIIEDNDLDEDILE